MLRLENHLGFEFVLFGKAFRCDQGMQMSGAYGNRMWHAALDVIHPDFLDAEQSVYLVKVDDKLVYVGEYSNTFKARWLKKGRYLWHSDNIDNQVNQLLQQGAEVTVWLSVRPYVMANEGIEINVSKSLELELIKTYQPEWNTVHKGEVFSKRRLRVAEIVAGLRSA